MEWTRANGIPDDFAEDAAFIRLSPQEWRQAAEARLRDLGLTYGELEQQAKERNFVSTAARKLWVLIGGTL